MNRTLVISGGSITHGGWPTWKDFVCQRYKVDNVVNLAQLGLGNEAIINRALIEVSKVENPVLMTMLTNVDKWDWYVQDDNKLKELNKEKHRIAKVHEDDVGGYWSTGSHFPLYKEEYKDKFYSSHYQLIHTINLILMLKSYTTLHNIPLLLLFDSPIFDCFEQELNQQPKILPTHNLKNLKTIKPFYDLISDIDLDKNLIGFCVKYKIPWYHKKYKGHPGSTAHYEFARKYIFPWTDKIFKIKNGFNETEQIQYASKMNDLWIATNKE